MLLRSNVPMLLCLLLWPAWSSQAEPLDLGDTRARWVSVEFEVSPDDLPGQVDTHYSLPYPAWLEPLEDGERARVTIAPEVVESLLRTRRPVPGSFSEFVWIFDRRTGEVLSAEFTGALREELEWGWIRKSTEARIRVDMASSGVAGFRGSQRILGNRVFRFCDEPSPRCTLMEGRALDATGYVHAVGKVEAVSHLISLETYSPLGEAIFRELEPVVPTVSAAPPELVRASLVGAIEEN